MADMPHLPKLRTFVDGLLKDWRCPVLSLALVKRQQDGQLTSETAHFGTQADTLQPSDKTLYNVGSVSKSFVAFAIAILVDEGRLKWDTRVQEIIPEFKVMDQKVSKEATIMDLLAHRCGTTKWQAFAPTSLLQQTAEESRRMLAYSEQSGEFRNSLVYSNAMFSVLGEVITRLSGLPFIDFVKKRIFDPLAMSTATYDPVSVAAPAVSSSLNFHQIGSMTQWIKDKNNSAFHAPGGLFMSCLDATKWLSFLVDRTQPDSASTLLVSPEQLKVIFSHHNNFSLGICRIPPDAAALQGIDAHPIAYCAAMNKSTYQGHTLYDHPGSGAGVAAQFTLAPEDGIGIMAFTTCATTGNSLATIVTFRILEDILQLEQVDWDARLRKEKLFVSEEPPIESQCKETREPADFVQYCGLYETNEGNRVLVSCRANINETEIGQALLDKIDSSTNLHTYQKGFTPQLYLLSPDWPHIGICTTYLALIPTSKSTFRAQARFQTNLPNGKTVDVQRRSIVPSEDGDLIFQIEKGKVVGLQFEAVAPDVGCMMRKVS